MQCATDVELPRAGWLLDLENHLLSRPFHDIPEVIGVKTKDGRLIHLGKGSLAYQFLYRVPLITCGKLFSGEQVVTKAEKKCKQ